MKPEHGKPTHISNAIHHQECQSIIKKNVGSEFPDASNKELYRESKCYAENVVTYIML